MFNPNATESNKLVEKSFLAGLSKASIKGKNFHNPEILEKNNFEPQPSFLIKFPRDEEIEPTILEVKFY